MEYKYEELKKKTVAELREIAKGIDHEAVQGYSQLNKEHLLEAFVKALNIDVKAHHVQAANKGAIKARIREWKKTRDQAIEAKDKKKLEKSRSMIHRLKRELHRSMV